jgi:hypothetical protein
MKSAVKMPLSGFWKKWIEKNRCAVGVTSPPVRYAAEAGHGRVKVKGGFFLAESWLAESLKHGGKSNGRRRRKG